MRQAIVDHLRRSGPQAEEELLEAMREHMSEAALMADLQALRKDGRIRETRGRGGKFWRYDEDFACPECGAGYPVVKRGGRSGMCRGCYNDKRKSGATRFAPDEVGPGYPARAMIELMRRPWA